MMVERASSSDILLPVRRVVQTETWSCWHAAAHTVLGYRNVVMGVVNMSSNIAVALRFVENIGLKGNLVTQFAQEVGLQADQGIFAKGFSTAQDYGNYVKLAGPLWVPVRRGSNGHVVVVIGVAGGKLAIADPYGAQPPLLWLDHAGFESSRLALPILYYRHALGH